MKRILGFLALTILILTTGCVSTPEEKSENQIKNDKFIEALIEKGEYTELKHLNHSNPVYYKVLKASPNPDGQRPFVNSEVMVKLSGKLITGEIFQPEQERMMLTIFDVTNSSPVGVVTGLQYALQAMTIGDEWEVVVPYKLGYGGNRQGTIPPYSTLIFKVELLKITRL